MDYIEARKKIQTQKPKDHFMVFEMAYNCKIILPYKDALAFMASMVNAEKLQDGYSEPHRIVPVERDTLRSFLMSSEEYEQWKIAGLLNLTPDEVKEAAKAAATAASP